MIATTERAIPIGLTGDISKDGILSPGTQIELDRLQTNAADACMEYLDRMAPDAPFPLVFMATGVGKGKIIHELIKRQKARKQDSKILLVTGTKIVLVDQTDQALTAYQQEQNDFDMDEDLELDQMDFEKEAFGEYTFDKYGNPDVDVQLATIQRIQRQHKEGKLNANDFDLLIVDEVHNVGTQNRFNAIDNFQRVVGFTATPYRYTGPMKTPQSYGFEIITSLSLPEAQERKILPPLYALQINTSELLKDEQIPTTRTGKIDYSKLEKVLKAHPELREFIANRVAPIINFEGRSYKTVVTVNFVWEALELAWLFRDKGIKVGLAVNQYAAKNIDTKEIPALDTIRRYKLPEGDPESLQVLISPYVISEGFDAPATEILVWASPTDSYLRYTQYTGRLARRHFGKAYGLVVDCLYQTSQYGWTYNFAMWMKGYVQELEPGLLYLGPMSEIKDVEVLRRIHEISDNIHIRELQREGILPIQENDLPLSQNWIRPLFQGDWLRLTSLIDEIKEEYRITGEEVFNQLFTTRLSGNQLVLVCTNRDIFIQRLIDKGAKPKVEKPREGEIPLTQINLPKLFVGNFEDTLRPMLNSIMARIKNEDPEEYQRLFAKRMQGREIYVCTNKDRLIQLMVEAGAKLRPGTKVAKEKMQTSDFALTADNLGETFITGRTKKIREVIRKIKESLPEGDSLFTFREYKYADVEVVTDFDRFVQLMLQTGVKLRPKNFIPIQPNDIQLSRDLLKTFLGQWREISTTAQRAKERLERQFPDDCDTLFVVRTTRVQNKPLWIDVCTDRSKFIKAMVEEGARLRDQADINLLPIQENDIVLSFESFYSISTTNWSKLKVVIRRIKDRIKEEMPEEFEKLFVKRKNRRGKSEVCTDRGLFIKWLEEEGVKLRQIPLVVRHRSSNSNRNS